MNRLVVIGNGFDLAHGLPTSYKDFIDDYWANIKDSNHNELVSFCLDKYVQFNNHKNLSDLIDLITDIDNSFKKNKVEVYKLSSNPIPLVDNRIQILNYKNLFFKLINKSYVQNWFDIENIYYNVLKDISKGTNKYSYNGNITKLNEEFEIIKNLLEKYLKEKVVEKYNFNIDNIEGFNFHNIFFPDILDLKKTARWREDFSKEDKEYIDELIEKGNYKNVKLRFLNFNYTPTSKSYARLNFDLFQDSEYFIHGELNNSNNKINFGFGDEMDEDYKLIENIDDNEYLKNFKSFQYLQNDTYKKLIDFVESEKFEVFIMGSSCGLSDRTLLNTIFEHKNCRLIKVFYYQWEENGEKKDNFTELTQNISRHFTDKKLMRSKIVHKKPEHLMPKIQLPKKE